MKRATVVAAALLAGAWSLGAKPAKEKGAAAFRMHPADQAEFKAVEGIEGVETARLWGDMAKDADWGTLFRFKAGTDTGWHLHSGHLHLVMVSGTLSLHPQGGEAAELSTGSFVDEAAKVVHRTVCKEGADCVFLIHGNKKFDFVKAPEPGAKK